MGKFDGDDINDDDDGDDDDSDVNVDDYCNYVNDNDDHCRQAIPPLFPTLHPTPLHIEDPERRPTGRKAS